MKLTHRPFILALIAAASAVTPALADPATVIHIGYAQTNLVSDGSVSSAPTTDPNLVNPWGITAFPGAPFWIANNHTGTSTLYDGAGNKIPLTVTIPLPPGAASGSVAAPTGIVFNPNPLAFQVSGQSSLFIFATEDGTISAWSPAVDRMNAKLQVDNSQSGAVYKGLALAGNAMGVFLYATNFNAGTVDVFDSMFKPAKLPGTFSDPGLPAGYAPFGIALVDGNLFVTYALQKPDKHDDQSGPGHGYVDVFDTNGNLIRRFASAGLLNSPWAVVRAPLNFGLFSSRILIGNFGDGHITGFDSQGVLHGQLGDTSGKTVVIQDLWGLAFGNAVGADSSKLYFTSGPNDESNGLFGFLQSVAITTLPATP
jgi:uncharacterized protein (TIGR03118 family)